MYMCFEIHCVLIAFYTILCNTDAARSDQGNVRREVSFLHFPGRMHFYAAAARSCCTNVICRLAQS